MSELVYVEVKDGMDRADKMQRIARLVAAAERVVWFDWTGNDTDAVQAIEDLRRALRD